MKEEIIILKKDYDRFEIIENEVYNLKTKIEKDLIYEEISEDARKYLREVLKALNNILEEDNE